MCIYMYIYMYMCVCVYGSAEWLDGRNQVVGKLVQGYDLLSSVADRFGSVNGVPREELYIGACGKNESNV